MTTYTNIQANTQASEPLTTTVVTALDRNLYALFEGDSTATPYAQLQEPAIEDLAVTPTKIAPTQAPTSGASTGTYTNAAPVTSTLLNLDPRTSTSATYTTLKQTITRAGSYTFFLHHYTNQLSGAMTVRTQLFVDGTAVITTTDSNNSSERKETTLTLLGGEEFYMVNTRIGGSGSIDVGACLAVLIKDTTTTDDIYPMGGICEDYRDGASQVNYFQPINMLVDWNNLVYSDRLAWFKPSEISTIFDADNIIDIDSI